MFYIILLVLNLLTQLSWSTEYSASYESSSADEVFEEQAERYKAQIESLNIQNIKLIGDRWLDITITNQNKNQMAVFFGEQVELLAFYDPIVIIECAIDNSLLNLITSLPKLSGLRLKRATPLSTNEAELLARVMGDFSHTLRELNLSGTFEWVPDPRYTYLRKINISNLIGEQTIIPILLSLKAIAGLESLTLSANDQFKSSYPSHVPNEQEHQVWAEIGQISTLKFLDISHFHISTYFYGIEKYLAKLDQLEEVHIGHNNLRSPDFLSAENFASLKVLKIDLTYGSSRDLNKNMLEILQNKPELEELEIFEALEFGTSGLTGEFLESLEHVPLKRLLVKNQKLTGEYLRIFHYMNLSDTLIYLNLSRNKLDDEGLNIIIAALKFLEFLDLSYNQLTQRGFRYSHKFAENLGLFEVRGNELNNSDRFEILEKFAESHPHTEVIIFTEEQISSQPLVKFILDGTMDGTVVDAANLPDDEVIGDAGARLLILQVLLNGNLQELWLEKLSPQGLIPVLEALEGAPHIASLVLFNAHRCINNPELFPSNSFEALALTTLRIKNNTYLPYYLRLPQSLTELEISHNEFLDRQHPTQSIWRFLTKILSTLPNLKILKLSHNNLTITGDNNPTYFASYIGSVREYLLSDRHQIKELDLSHNKLGGYFNAVYSKIPQTKM